MEEMKNGASGIKRHKWAIVPVHVSQTSVTDDVRCGEVANCRDEDNNSFFWASVVASKPTFVSSWILSVSAA